MHLSEMNLKSNIRFCIWQCAILRSNGLGTVGIGADAPTSTAFISGTEVHFFQYEINQMNTRKTGLSIDDSGCCVS